MKWRETVQYLYVLPAARYLCPPPQCRTSTTHDEAKTAAAPSRKVYASTLDMQYARHLPILLLLCSIRTVDPLLYLRPGCQEQ